MINSVRQTVMSVLNKNNYGYISPSDFNLYAKQAQLDLFENYFYQYNYQLQKENARQSGTGYADITKGLEEVINTFSETKFLSNQVLGTFSSNRFFTPSPTTTGDDYYLINRVVSYSTLLASGNTTANVGNQLVDAAATFFATGIQAGDVVVNTTDSTSTIITAVTNTILGLRDDIFTATPCAYKIYDASTMSEVERVSQSEITRLNTSSLTSPTVLFPAYTLDGDVITVYPSSINETGRVECQYVRYPRDPKWTFTNITGGEPIFDQTQSDYQDFELTIDDEVDLVMKILQMAGMSIREIQAVQFAKTEDQINIQEKK